MLNYYKRVETSTSGRQHFSETS